jgi:hypothetical protein
MDLLVVATHAPGQSAYNPVERRMAPLSRDLSGLILPFDFYGSHLNSSNKTVDFDLEKRNFAYAGRSLAEIWSNSVWEFMILKMDQPIDQNLDNREASCRG